MKKLLLLVLGITLVFGNKFSSQAAFEYDAPEELNGFAMIRETLILPGGTMEAFVPKVLNEFTDGEIETFFWKTYGEVEFQDDIDADLWEWFLNSPKYTTQQKYEICNTTKATSNILCYWILLNEEISVENKVQYFRTHDIRYTDDNIKNWWWINIGSKLTIADVNPTDAGNFSIYRRALYSSSINNNVEYVYIGSEDGGACYMDSNDVEECIKQGTIRVENVWYRVGNGPEAMYKKYYSLVGYNTGYMMWRLR